MTTLIHRVLSAFLVMVIGLGEMSGSSPEKQAQKTVPLRAQGERLLRNLKILAEIGRTPEGGVSRLAFSEADLRAREHLINLMKAAGLEVGLDPAGNLSGRREGRKQDLPPILFGSHLDTVPNGGLYDGALGVLAALECLQVLEENKVTTDHPLEMIVFTDEEGGTIGSRALAGGLDEHVLEAVSQSGKTIRGGISFLGGDPGKLAAVVRPKGSITAYLELHIEQGQILESKKVDIGVVEGIVGIGRWEVTVEGFANHAGTTPMDQRQDALLAAADLILAVNRVVRKAPGCQVGTVGRIKAEPGAVNVVPGRVVMSLELRDLSLEKIRTLLQEIQEEAERISEYSRTKISFAPIDELTLPAFSDPAISRLIQLSAEELGLATLTMPSGAGHDAQNISKIAPMGMIFIPSLGGVSHSPQEFSRPGDIIAGANVLLQTLLKIDRNGR